MFGSYYGTSASQHTYVDTSQPLSGLGADAAALTIYEGVGSAAPRASSCGCRGSVGYLGNEVPPDALPPLPDALPPLAVVGNSPMQTILVGLLIAGSAIAIGAAVLGTKPSMTANGRRRRRARKMRANARHKVPAWFKKKNPKRKTTPRQASAAGTFLSDYRWGDASADTANTAGTHLAHWRFHSNGKVPEIYMSSYCNHGHSMKTGKPIRHQCRVIPPAALRAERDGDFRLAQEILAQTRPRGMGY